MRMGRKVNSPKITRLGPTNNQAMRDKPSQRWPMRKNGSNRLKKQLAMKPTTSPGRQDGWQNGEQRRNGPAGRCVPLYFLACLTDSAMSLESRVMASLTLISPTMAWVTRVTVGNISERLY